MIVPVFVMFAHRFPWLQPLVNFFSRAENCHVLIRSELFTPKQIQIGKLKTFKVSKLCRTGIKFRTHNLVAPILTVDHILRVFIKSDTVVSPKNNWGIIMQTILIIVCYSRWTNKSNPVDMYQVKTHTPNFNVEQNCIYIVSSAFKV